MPATVLAKHVTPNVCLYRILKKILSAPCLGEMVFIGATVVINKYRDVLLARHLNVMRYGRTHSPDLPPVFLTNRICSMLMPRSTALHIS